MAGLRFCRTCGDILKRVQKCDRCIPVPKKRHKQKTTERGYGWDWQQLSLRYRTQHPLCERCYKANRLKPADHVHHRVPINEAPELRMDITNLMSLCEECHRAIHAEERAEQRSATEWQAE